ncbi:MAG: putative N-acyltransferase [Cellvibrionaceae bacterium]|jgi:predicted N-acyltransferase
MTKLIAQFLSQINQISNNEWNELVGNDYPFLQHEFLNALEQSGSASAESGWTPNHLIVRDEKDQLVAVAPAYLKTHSYGEYVFDWAWANAYEQNRMPYYPKLLTAIPFTPCTGPRIRVKDGPNAADVYRFCIQEMIGFCESNHLSSWHLLFPQEAEEDIKVQTVLRQHLMKRSGVQYHWYNDNFGSFSDYLGAMKARKRNSIRKEREKVEKQAITFTHINGRDATSSQVQDFYVFYHATYMKRGRYGYLNQEFFERLVETMPEKLLFVFAQKDGGNIASALFFIGEDTLFGRYWGCLDEYDQLHFETCFYQGIDYCIQHGLQHIDAGAQGEHKIQRGFRPIETTSWHWIAHPAFEEAIQNFLDEEGPQIQHYIDDAQRYLPFKQAEK